VTTFNLNILPIHRINGQESADLPGLLAVTPPRKAARGREKDNLVVYLMLSGNTALSAAELSQLNNDAAGAFYQSAGSLTSALRKTAESINAALLARNLASTGRGQYALGWLALAALREAQCTLLLSGPAHAVLVSEGQSRHIHDAALSGKGLGSSQSFQAYLSQVELHSNDLLVLCAKFPMDWEADLINERPPASLDASYRKLTFTRGDLHAALIQAQSGHGMITILRPEVSAPQSPALTVAPVPSGSIGPQGFEPLGDQEREESPVSSSITEEELDAMADFAAHMVQPSAYAIPPQPEEMIPLPEEESIPDAAPPAVRDFPPSIPRAKPVEPVSVPTVEKDRDEETAEGVSAASEPVPTSTKTDKPSAHA